MTTATYLHPQDLVDRFGSTEMAQVGEETGTVTGAQLQSAIGGDTSNAAAVAQLKRLQTACNRAQVRADSYVGIAETLPLPSVPDALTDYCCDLARQLLYDDQVPEAIQKAADVALASLKDIAAGRATLGLAVAGAGAGPGDTVSTTTTADDRLLTADTLAFRTSTFVG